MTQEDKKQVIDALEELKGDSTGLIAATIEDCQKVVMELPEGERSAKGNGPANEIIADLRRCTPEGGSCAECPFGIYGASCVEMLHRAAVQAMEQLTEVQ